jgi:N utilization substance protein A
MATKKKTKKKPSKRRASKQPVKIKATKKKSSPKIAKKQTPTRKKKLAVAKKAQKTGSRAGRAAFSRERQQSSAAGQSGDLQGLSRRESADSESVDELLEEGNAFEADAVSGVEEADLADGKEVHTHEVPEDDVPGEYLDEE